MHFQKQTTRNGYDFQYEQNAEGRHVLTANHEGVRKRCGLIVTALGRFETFSKEDVAVYLRKNFHNSYTANDVGSAFKRLIDAGIVKCNGRGPGTTYSLTKKGAEIWKGIDKDWR